jgi:hypothetical protein
VDDGDFPPFDICETSNQPVLLSAKESVARIFTDFFDFKPNATVAGWSQPTHQFHDIKVLDPSTRTLVLWE